MKFFVPHAKDDAQAEDVWQSTKKFAESKGSKISDRRIFRIHFHHKGKNCVDEVGKVDTYGMEEVLVILESGSLYYACTANRGVVRGEPLLIGKNEVSQIEDFN